jgi:hypothetical protein
MNSLKRTKELQMNKFTTEQLKEALIGLYARKDADSNAAYALAFEELNRRMGDQAFDAFLDQNGL